jgi:hypothetical protein
MEKTFNKIMDRIDGYKTYIIIVLALITVTLGHFSVLAPEEVTSILVYLGLSGLAALRSTASKIIKK